MMASDPDVEPRSVPPSPRSGRRASVPTSWPWVRLAALRSWALRRSSHSEAPATQTRDRAAGARSRRPGTAGRVRPPAEWCAPSRRTAAPVPWAAVVSPTAPSPSPYRGSSSSGLPGDGWSSRRTRAHRRSISMPSTPSRPAPPDPRAQDCGTRCCPGADMTGASVEWDSTRATRHLRSAQRGNPIRGGASPPARRPATTRRAGCCSSRWCC